jgi:hypothetical protein
MNDRQDNDIHFIHACIYVVMYVCMYLMKGPPQSNLCLSQTQLLFFLFVFICILLSIRNRNLQQYKILKK